MAGDLVERRAQVIGAVVHGGVTHVHQAVALSVLDEDDFFVRTGLRMSWPARVCLQRVLQEDVLLQDLRMLINEGVLSFNGSGFELLAESDLLASKRVARISSVLDQVNPELINELDGARELLRA